MLRSGRISRGDEETLPLPERLLEVLDDVVLWVDRAGVVQWASPRVLDLAGYAPRELTGRQLGLLLSLESRDESSAAAAGGTHLEAYRKDGSSFPAAVRRQEISPESGSLVFVRDLSEVSRAGQSLRQLTQAIETASSGIAIADRDLAIRHANPALSAMFGLSHEQVLGESLQKLFPAALAGRDFRDLAALRSLQLESESRRRDGSPFPVELRFDLVTGEDGTAAGVVAVALDITERRRTEEALRRSEERFALAVRGANDGIWDWDLQSDRVYYSERWQTLLGLEPGAAGASPDEWFSRVHEEDLPGLTASLQRHLAGETDCFEHEHRMLHADGNYRWMLARGAVVWGRDLKPMRMAGSQTDITDRKVHDPLTGLPNRALFLDRLERARARSQRGEAKSFAVLFLDLDRFNIVNDSLGHVAGDRLLVDVARRIESSLRAGDTVARIGGDEFAILLEEIESDEHAQAITQRVHDALQKPFELSGRELFVTASIGIAVGDQTCRDLTGMLRDADTAMYRAKFSGRGRSQVFTSEMHKEMVQRLQIESDLRRALQRGEFEVFYQPIVTVRGRRLPIAFEALVRWHHPEAGLLLPAAFIAIAEETGAILSLGMWVLETACAQLAEWRGREPRWSDVSMHVNLSPRLFAQPDLVARVAEILARTQLPARCLKLEITEGVFIDDPEQASAMLRELRAMGLGVSLDDFGTGYSSLSYLNRLAVDQIKIDRSFVAEITSSADKVELVRNMLRLASDLGLQVIAEGVETIEQRDRLASLDCRLMQGFEFSRAVPADGAWRLFHP